MAATAYGAVASVLHTGTTSGRAEGAVGEVLWSDRTNEQTEPLAFVLSQDIPLRGNVLSSATSQQGARMGIAYPTSTNEGDLLPYLSGAWDTSLGSPQPLPTSLSFMLVGTGGLFSGAEWAWKYATDAGNQWRGADDMRYLSDVHIPWTTKIASSHNVVAYSKAFNRVLVARYRSGTQQFDLAYRSANTVDASAGYSNIVVPAVAFALGKIPDFSQCGYSAIVELPDGGLRWFYCYVPDTTAPSSIDVDMLISNDGGLTWTVGREAILTALFGSTQTLVGMRVAVSGDWLRMELWNLSSAPQGLCSAYSGDRGATWGLATGTPDGLDNTASNTDTTMRFETFALEGLGTLDGSFFRVRPISTGALWQFQMCSRDGEWTAVYTLPYGTGKAVWLARGGAYLHLLQQEDNGAGACLFGGYSFLIPLDRVPNGWDATAPRVDKWVKWGGDILGLNGVMRWSPKCGTLAWVGDRLAFCAGGLDRETGTTSAQWKPATVSYWSGYDRRPLYRAAPATTDEFGSMFTEYWSAQTGSPAGGGTDTSAFSPWGQSSGGAPTQTHIFDALQMVASATARASFSNSQLIAGATQFMADGGSMGWTTRATAATGAQLPTTVTAGAFRAPSWGAAAQLISVTAGQSFNIGVHVTDSGQVGVFDALGVNTLYLSAANAVAGITSGSWYDFRVGFGKPTGGGSTWFVDVAWAKSGDNTWSSTGAMTMTTGVLPTAYQLASFGQHSTSLITSTYEWREFWYNRDQHLGQLAPINPGGLRGVLASPYRVAVAQGIDVRWGGGGGFEGDTFTAPVRYDYGAEQVLAASPDGHWRSTSGTTQTLHLDAGLAVAAGVSGRLRHSGASVVGTNSRYLTLEYSSTAALTFPTRITVDGLRYTAPLQAQTLAANSVRVTAATAAQWRDMELAGHYCRATATNSSPNPSILRIEQNHGDTILFAGVTQLLSSYGITSSGTLEIWADRHLLAFVDHPLGVRVVADPNSTGTMTVDADFPRYLRVTVPGQESQGAPPEGYWRVGALVAGMTLPITVPMGWEHSDSQSGIVQLETAVSGARTAYVAGTPRRVVAGTSEGDVERWRETFRATVRHLGQYGAQVMVLCSDDQRQSLSMLYSRFTAATEFANAGWRYDSTLARWVQVGDLSLTFEEEV